MYDRDHYEEAKDTWYWFQSAMLVPVVGFHTVNPEFAFVLIKINLGSGGRTSNLLTGSNHEGVWKIDRETHRK